MPRWLPGALLALLLLTTSAACVRDTEPRTTGSPTGKSSAAAPASPEDVVAQFVQLETAGRCGEAQDLMAPAPQRRSSARCGPGRFKIRSVDHVRALASNEEVDMGPSDRPRKVVFVHEQLLSQPDVPGEDKRIWGYWLAQESGGEWRIYDTGSV